MTRQENERTSGYTTRYQEQEEEEQREFKVELPSTDRNLSLEQNGQRIDEHANNVANNFIAKEEQDGDKRYMDHFTLSGIARELHHDMAGKMDFSQKENLPENFQNSSQWIVERLNDRISSRLFDKISDWRPDPDRTNFDEEHIKGSIGQKCLELGGDHFERTPEQAQELHASMGTNRILEIISSDQKTSEEAIHYELVELSKTLEALAHETSRNIQMAEQYSTVPADQDNHLKYIHVTSIKDAINQELTTSFDSQTSGINGEDSYYFSKLSTDYEEYGVLTDDGKNNLRVILDAVETMPQYSNDRITHAAMPRPEQYQHDPEDDLF